MGIIGNMIWVPKFTTPTYQIVLYGRQANSVVVDGDSVSLSGGTATIYLPKGIHSFEYHDNSVPTHTHNLDINGDCSVVMAWPIGTMSMVESDPVHNYNGGSKTAYGSKTATLPSDNIAPITKGYVSGRCRVRQNNSSYNVGPGCSIGGHIEFAGVSAASQSTVSNALSYSSGFSGNRYSNYYTMSGTATFTARTTGNVVVGMYATVTESSGSAATYAYAQVEVNGACYIY